MAAEISSEKLQDPESLDHQCVADVFVKKYYAILENSPDIVHRFYKDHSVIYRPGSDGGVASVTTMQKISDTIMSSDYKGCLAEILNADSQESLMGGIIVAVNGYLTVKDNMRKSFYQTFFLDRQEKGFYVLNDILRFMDAHEKLTLSACSEIDKSSLSVQLTDATETATLPCQPEPTKASEAEDGSKKVADAQIQNEFTKPKTSYASAVEEGCKKVFNVKDSHSPNAKIRKVSNVKDSHSPNAQIPKVSNAKDSHPPNAQLSKVSNAKDSDSLDAQIPKVSNANDSHSSNAQTPKVSNAKDSHSPDAQILKVSNVKDSHFPDAQIPKESTTLKTSYASMVAKKSNVATPTHISGGVVMRTSSTSVQQPKISPVVPSISATKELNSSNNTTENSSSNGDAVLARSVYIGNLPSNLTKQGLLDALKEFGRIRQELDGIQLRTFEDGFCFGFVEFESASSARSAVEVRNIALGENNAYILYKRSSTRSGDDNGGFRRGYERGEFHGNGFGHDGNHSDLEDRQNGQTNPNRSQTRDTRGQGRELYRRNYPRTDERRSNGEAYPRHYHQREDRLINAGNNQRR